MCGIAGINYKNKETLQKMLNSIEHRGPDGEGMEVNDKFSIGMRRLSIIDPKSGWQPIYNEDRSLCIIMNGEIYNYQKLWLELEKRGHKFSTHNSDTETVLHGYEEWGEKVLDRLTGMFAIAIYNFKTGKLFVARDRLGIKPLYYYIKGDRIAFASEIKALLTTDDCPREANLDVLYEYLMYRVHDRGEETFFKGIKRLLPGHYMYIRSENDHSDVLIMSNNTPLEQNATEDSIDDENEFAENEKDNTEMNSLDDSTRRKDCPAETKLDSVHATQSGDILRPKRTSELINDRHGEFVHNTIIPQFIPVAKNNCTNNSPIISIKRYWYPSYNPEFTSEKSDQEYAEEFYSIYKSVIKRHLISDVPVGVSLSGGLDSSGVVSVMRELIDEGTDLNTHGKLYTFSALFPGLSIDESRFIKEVEEFAKTEPVYAYPKVNEFWGEMSQWIRTQEEPTISSAPYAYYSVYRVASKHVKVMLSGNGGDELLAGYIPYFRAYLSSSFDQGRHFKGISEFIRGADLYKTFVTDKLNTLKPWKEKLMMSNFLNRSGFGDVTKFSYEASRNLNERLMQDVLMYSTPNLLRYEDKNSMAFSIESRVPFLDHKLVEYIFNLPIDQKIKYGWNRYIYRNAMKGHMPELNRLRRSKIGFTNPELSWMIEKKDVVSDIFSSQEFISRGLFDTMKLNDVFNRWAINRKAFSGDALIFWRILNVELWFREMVG